MNLYRIITIVLLTITIQSCNQFKSNKNSDRLNEVINTYQDHEGYDSKKYPLGLVTKEHYKNEADFANGLLLGLSLIDTTYLDDNDKISFKLLGFKLQDIIDYYEFERHLNPLLSDTGFHSSLGYMVRPLYNYNQVKNYLNKLNAIPDYVDQYFVNLREGLSKGVSQPLVIFKGYESTYNDHITRDHKDNYFYSPFKNLPDDLNQSQIDSILYEGQKAIEESVIPEFKRIKEFFENEYFPNTRTKIGISEIENGLDYYQNRINFYTTSKSYNADKIHKIGLDEVSRIRKGMIKIISDLKFKGSFDDFFKFLRTDDRFYAKTPKELLMFARDISKRIDAKLPKFFKTLPRKPYGVAPVPDAIAPKYTGGRYVGTSKNSTEPGYYWVNTYDLKSRTLYTIPALTAHEGVPGHHLQGSLNNELGDSIPRFRRNLYLSAFGEGWGLYSEFLADDMGIYTTKYEQFGKLTYEMWRACRLVVDTGIHAMGWTREEAVEYMSKNTALSLHEINTEVDRYISWPGQALSYKIGEIKIRELRKKAKDQLGNKFNIRDFHEVVLSQGTVTLSILEERINKYINKTKNE
ncbi:MAG: DUF885 domain-containing protein [Flavobacteriaceae bacterium]|jgi:uncharacterized protein (DUF885 family)|nr:DUF885 domain-containing protein [Flavobacteriaceae bacterium]MBT4112771.1 DUF885 domain-containing protein [Flavobacteriaceae bacterium]MBT4613646.1 DUF885 domain-containing protein [Flavobacteriaceae bacterium]MBT5246530.1 DUF885 domain-containing protein [Flavobacteriaceae bacterium]MBT5649654.1 DUF885 domain-containing protein [Flavobacteriaceae bacterium]